MEYVSESLQYHLYENDNTANFVANRIMNPDFINQPYQIVSGQQPTSEDWHQLAKKNAAYNAYFLAMLINNGFVVKVSPINSLVF